MFGALLDVQTSSCLAGTRDYAPWQKWAEREGFVAFPKTMAGVGVGHLQRIWQDVFRAAGAVQETCSSELFGGQGADFLRGVAFWSIRSSGFAEMILRDGCSTSYDLASLFRRRSTLDTWTGKIARRTRPWALHSTFEFWRKSRWMALFLMLSPSKNEEVSQNCFVFALVNFENWESLAVVTTTETTTETRVWSLCVFSVQMLPAFCRTV